MLEKCAMLDQWGWYDKTCTDTFPFVCFDGK